MSRGSYYRAGQFKRLSRAQVLAIRAGRDCPICCQPCCTRESCRKAAEQRWGQSPSDRVRTDATRST